MATFDYSAYDNAGKLVEGVVTADSERHARRLLKEKNLLPATMAEVNQTTSATSEHNSGRRILGRRRVRQARVNNFDLSESFITSKAEARKMVNDKNLFALNEIAKG